MAEKMTHYARYLYPGVLFPEDRSREIHEPTYRAALESQPDDGWYAVEITSNTYKLFTADDGEETWVKTNTQKAGSWIIGEKVHYTAIPDNDVNHILRANIRGNSRDGGFGVKTRCGNWQVASDWDHVVPV